jgi:cytochrome c5
MKSQQMIIALLAALAIHAASIVPSSAQQVSNSDPQNQAEQRALFLRGAQLWPVYCNTCHNARTGAEFSPAEWRMIMMHMRTQANLPANDARAVLEYLRSSR